MSMSAVTAALVACAAVVAATLSHVAPAAAAAATGSESPPGPHIVMIVVDDLGSNDTSIRWDATTDIPNGVRTPHMQALRDGGILINDHTVFKFCSPSRSQYLSGRYAYHLGQQTYNNLSPEGAPCGLNTSYDFLSALLHDHAGYFTAAFGKWHQGFALREYTPTARGFDRFGAGIYTGGQTYFTHVASYHFLGTGLPEWWTPADNSTLPNPGGCTSLWDLHNDSAAHGPSSPSFARAHNGTYSAALVAAAFEEALAEHRATAAAAPLFAYVAFHGVHLPLEVPAEYLRRYAPGTFGDDVDRLKLAAMASAVDDAVGRIVAGLQGGGYWNNTLLLFTTDNGAPVCTNGVPAAELCSNRSCGGSNGVLRGSKMTDWQGGVRGLAVLSGGVVPESRRNTTYSKGMVHQTDWYPALARLGGVPEARVWNESGPLPPDGVAGVLAAILRDEPSPRTELVHNIYGTHPGAIRVGDLKLVVGDPNLMRPYNGYNGWFGVDVNGTSGPLCTLRPCLFNVSADPQERHDLALDLPGALQQLRGRYDELRASEVSVADSGLCPPGLPVVDGCLANAGTGVWNPWLTRSPKQH